MQNLWDIVFKIMCRYVTGSTILTLIANMYWTTISVFSSLKSVNTSHFWPYDRTYYFCMIYLVNLKTSEGAHNLLMFHSNEYSVILPQFRCLAFWGVHNSQKSQFILTKVLVHAFSMFLRSVVALMICPGGASSKVAHICCHTVVDPGATANPAKQELVCLQKPWVHPHPNSEIYICICHQWYLQSLLWQPVLYSTHPVILFRFITGATEFC